MIVDFHSHIWRREWRNESMWEAMVDLMMDRLGSIGGETARGAIKNDIFANYLDPSGELHLRQMEEAGIDVTVLHPLDYGLASSGEAPATIEEQNAAHAELVKRHPDKFVAFTGVDPRRPNAVDLVERGVQEWGFKGLKLHPAAGYHPDDPSVDGVFEKACELDIPVLVHTGHISPPLDESFCRPSRLGPVAERYPELTIIAAHMGFDWWAELVEVARARPNVCADISGWQPEASMDGGPFCRILREMLDCMGAGRIFFGTDGLIFSRALAAGAWIRFIRQLPKEKEDKVEMGDDEIEAILGLNAQKLLSL